MLSPLHIILYNNSFKILSNLHPLKQLSVFIGPFFAIQFKSYLGNGVILPIGLDTGQMGGQFPLGRVFVETSLGGKHAGILEANWEALKILKRGGKKAFRVNMLEDPFGNLPSENTLCGKNTRTWEIRTNVLGIVPV